MANTFDRDLYDRLSQIKCRLPHAASRAQFLACLRSRRVPDIWLKSPRQSVANEAIPPCTKHVGRERSQILQLAMEMRWIMILAYLLRSGWQPRKWHANRFLQRIMDLYVFKHDIRGEPTPVVGAVFMASKHVIQVWDTWILRLESMRSGLILYLPLPLADVRGQSISPKQGLDLRPVSDA